MKRIPILAAKLSPLALRLGVLFALSLIVLRLTGVGQASGFISVNSTEDVKNNDGVCSLREAIIAANTDKRSGGKPGECAAGSGADTDTIVLQPGTYILTRTDNGKEDASQTGDLDVAGDLDIIVEGPGATIDGAEITDRVFHILGGEVTITGVTIKNGGGNVDDGGGIYNVGVFTLTNVTVSGNTADAEGGGIYNTGTLNLNNVTVANNTAVGDGGGIVNHGGTINLHNTIVASNDPSDCLGTLFSQGYNLDSDGTCNLTGPGDISNGSARLGPLQNNGGKTETHALLGGSPAIDAGDNATCEATDQRGEVRPLDGDDDGQARCDIGAFEFRRNNFVLIRAFVNAEDGTTVQGLLNGNLDTTVKLDFYNSMACPAPGVSPVGDPVFNDVVVTTDEHGYFTAEVGAFPRPDGFVYATATGLNDNPLGFSNCISLGSNTSWPFARSLDDEFDNGTAWVEQYLATLGQSRWYRFKVEPNSEVIVTLTGLEQVAANYDLTIYKDIKEAFLAFLVPEEDDLVPLNAQFAGDAFAGDAFAGDAFAGDAFAGDAFAGDAFAGDAFAGDAFAGDAFAGDAFAGDAFAGDAFAGDAFAGDAFAGDAFAGDAFAASVFAGDAFAGDAFAGDAFAAAFSSAQFRSLIGVSAFEGTFSEGIFVNTWSNNGEFYVRVRGRNGAFSLNAPFHLEVTVFSEVCNNIISPEEEDFLNNTDPLPPDGNFKTLIVYDSSRLDRIEGSDQVDFEAKLEALAIPLEVGGHLLDVSRDPRVNFSNGKADANPACPYAKNLVAQTTKDIIDGYRTQDGSILEYIVLIGGDDVVPFFRHPDNALLAPESQYSPPVKNSTASQASLKLDYVLSQDAYGSKFDLSLNNSTYPVPELAVGRLVEAADEISTMIDAYLNQTDNGVVAPQTSLTTGYDFLYDAAVAIGAELEAGTGNAPAELLTEGAPTDPPTGWTAQDLRDALLPANGQAPDIAFLAGHFTTNAALAADYVTSMSASEVADSSVDMTNAIIFSAGCHAGYNTVDDHGLNILDQDGNVIVTKQPDWAQAFASKGATLVAGTGYQYGETDYLEYSERIYFEFSRQLRLASAPGPVSVGQALMEAKKVYLSQTPKISGLHEKALLEASIFGLPFLKVDLARTYSPPPVPQPQPPLSLEGFTTDPGLALGLQYDDIAVESPLDETIVPLQVIDAGDHPPIVDASYLSGTNGVASNLGEPALPLEMLDVSVSGTTLRGVGWRGGRYQVKDVIPLTGAPATEVSGVHTPFLTDYFHPVQMWRVNYWDAVDDPSGGITQLMVTPAQHKISSTLTDPQESTRRQFKETDLRLYYSNNVTDYSTEEGIRSIPGLSGPPVIVRVSAEPNNGVVAFEVLVTSNPAAGVQEVWVTYTDTGVDCLVGSEDFCTWQSLDLTQNPAESTIWRGELDLAGITDAANIQFMVQAVNGVGLIGRAENLGKYFVPGVDPAATKLQIVGAPSEGDFGTKATFSAKLTEQQSGAPIGGQPVTFRLASFAADKRGLASVSGVALTGPDGVATINFPLRALPGDYQVSAFFAGSATLKPSLDKGDKFTINRQDTEFCHPLVAAECVLSASLALDPDADTGIVAVLTDDTGRRLRERTVFIEAADMADPANTLLSIHTITDWRGRAFLGPVNLPAGQYIVKFSFVNGTIELPTNDPLNPVETVELLDDGYNPTSTTGSLTLNINTPPIANAGGPYTPNEGEYITLDGGGSYDPDVGDSLSYEWDLDYDGVTFDVDATVVQPTVDFADDFSTRTIALRVTDSGGLTDLDTTDLTVNNVAPTVDAGDDQTVHLGDLVDLSATFTDPGSDDTHTATIAWGDGTVESGTIDQDAGIVSGVHTYSEPGVYTVLVTVTDDDGGSGNDTFTVIVVTAVSDPQTIWPPNSKMVLVRIIVTGLDVGTIRIDSIFQDEPVGDEPDAVINDNGTAYLRAERDGNGNGRVYHISFTVYYGGGTYSAEVKTAIVAHDQSGDIDSIDDGALYDSTLSE